MRLDRETVAKATLYLCAPLVLLLAAVGAVRSYSPVPFWDMWHGYLHFYQLVSEGHWKEWWALHNEHRIVIPKLIYLIDMNLFNYQGYVPIVFIFLLQGLTVVMLAWLLAGKGLASWEVWLLVALFIAAAFNLMQSENFASTFQTAFVGCFSFAVAAFVLYAKYTQNGRRSYLGGTVLFGILAGLSLAPGLFVWIVLALLAFLLHPRRYVQSLSFAAAFAASLLLYLAGYKSPGYHANPVESLLRHPRTVAEYLLVWLGNIAGTPTSAKVLGLLAVLGLAAVMHASALAFQVLKVAGVAYLFYVAYATWRDTAAFSVDRSVSRARPARIVVKGFLLNILNPKLTIFFLAFLPQFVEPGAAQPLVQLLTLSGIFMAMTFAVFVVYGLVAHAFRRYVIESSSVQRWLRYSFAAAFAGLGAQLAASER